MKTALLSKISHWYFSRKALPYWSVLLIDCVIVLLSAVFVIVSNYGVSFTISNFPKLCVTLFVYIIFYVISFRIFHTYSGILRYSSFVDLQCIAFAVIAGMFMSIIAKYVILPYFPDILLSVNLRSIILWSFLALLFMGYTRVAVKFLFDSKYIRPDATNVFIYGIKQGGVAIAKSLRNQGMSQYNLAGFISDYEDVSGGYLSGVKIYNNDYHIVDVMKSHNATALFVSPLKSEQIRDNQEMVDALISAGIKIFMVPKEEEWDGKRDIHMQQMREVDIEDLLPRKKIEVDMDTIGNQLLGKTILITGAAGSIGCEIVRQVSMYAPTKMILIDQAETPLHYVRLLMKSEFPNVKALTIVSDMSNSVRMDGIFSEHKPEYVFHAAAYKHVPMMEDNPSEAIHNNVEGTRIIANLALKYGAKKFVMVSTDKAVNPTNVMGCSKRLCEIYVQSLDKAIKDGKVKGETQFVTTRFGNVLGSNGSVIPIFREQIKKGGPLTVTHPNIIRYFMLIPEACKLVLEAGTMGHGGEIFVFDMGEPVKIVDLAKRMIKLSGVDIEIKYTGLRDGEKLYEEVLNEKETTLPTVHPKIMVAKVREYDFFEINKKYDNLIKTSMIADPMTIVRMMKEIVPEFRSQHSIYEVLDK